MVWHATDAWSRRHEPNVVLVHYADLSADLEGEMRRLAGRLDVTVPEDRWSDLVRAATFDEMRARAQQLAPDPAGVLKDRDAFFRRGTSGAGDEVLSPEELAHYHERVAALGPPEVVAWLHHGRGRRRPSRRRPEGGRRQLNVAVSWKLASALVGPALWSSTAITLVPGTSALAGTVNVIGFFSSVPPRPADAFVV